MGGLEEVNRDGSLSKIAGSGKIGRAGQVRKARGKETTLLLLTKLKPKKLK